MYGMKKMNEKRTVKDILDEWDEMEKRSREWREKRWKNMERRSIRAVVLGAISMGMWGLAACLTNMKETTFGIGFMLVLIIPFILIGISGRD